MKISKRRRRLTVATAAAAGAVAIAGVLTAVVPAGANVVPPNTATTLTTVSASATGLGQLNGLLPRNKLTAESAHPGEPGQRDGPAAAVPRDAYRAPGSRRRCGTSCWMPPTPGWRTTWG